MTTYVSAGTITGAGLTKMLQAQIAGTPFTISTVKLSSDVMACSGLETDMTNIVFTAPTTMVSQTVLTPNVIRTVLAMDTTVGNFSIGTMGIYTVDGTLYALGTFPGGGVKLADNLPSLAGNVRTLYLDVGYIDVTSALTPLIGAGTIVQVPIALKYVNGAVTARQMRTALAAAGRLTEVTSTVASSDPNSQAVIDWLTCAAVEPGSALLLFVAGAIGATDAGTAILAAAAALPA